MSRRNLDPETDALTDLHVARSFLNDVKAKLDKRHRLTVAALVAESITSLSQAIQQEQSTPVTK